MVFLLALFINPEKEGRGEGLAEERHVEALEKPPHSLLPVDLPEGVEDAAVARHQIALRFAIVAWVGGGVLWKRVLMRSKGWRTPAM
jgi:hypothetical protein